MRLDHVASFIMNENHSAMCATAKLCVVDCIRGFLVPQPPERERITD